MRETKIKVEFYRKNYDNRHHCDLNHDNNAKENILLCSKPAHSKIHGITNILINGLANRRDTMSKLLEKIPKEQILPILDETLKQCVKNGWIGGGNTKYYTKDLKGILYSVDLTSKLKRCLKEIQKLDILWEKERCESKRDEIVNEIQRIDELKNEIWDEMLKILL